jgi:hypothetical protein
VINDARIKHGQIQYRIVCYKLYVLGLWEDTEVISSPDFILFAMS